MDIDSILKAHGLGSSGGSPMIKSIQPVYIPYVSGGSGTRTYAISSVDTNSTIILAGSIWGTDADISVQFRSMYLSDSTTLAIVSVGKSYAMTVYVIEFDASAVESKQSGDTYVPLGTTNITINSVDPSKCIATIYAYHTSSTSSERHAAITGLTATTLTLVNQGQYGISEPTRWEVLELK